MAHLTITHIKQAVIQLFGAFICMLILSCIEPYENIDFTGNFEDVLVVNATITNETKKQEVLLSRSFSFEESEAPAEENAQIVISDGEGTEFSFEEVAPGTYVSTQEFAAQINTSYSLKITTNDGKNYLSTAMQLPVQNTSIDNLYAERIINDNNEDGIALYVDSYDPSGSSNYYRYEYIETFKIIAPYWSPLDAVVANEGISTFDVRAILREQEERTCYGENSSKNVLIQSTISLSEDRLDRYNIRFIEADDYILSYRYSILLKQFILSPEAFAYYETLSGLSQNSSTVFSEDQPGFLAGNIISMDSPDENVAGFFDVAAVDEQRIFFSYEDFFPEEEIPPFKVDCSISAPLTEGAKGERELLNLIYDDDIRFYDFNFGQIPGGGPFLVVRKECGDCTTLGSNKVPDFWIE